MAIHLDSDIQQLQQILAEQRAKGRTIGFVPTMGYLHEGHQSLIRLAHKAGHFTVVSNFVNPLQFGPNEDYDTYPRDMARDDRLSAEAGADLVWYPSLEDIYPAWAQTVVTPGALAQRLCGVSRPQFFGGICTVVLKFFHLIQPQQAYFGEKDFQQLAIIRRMVADFYLDVEIVGGATVREPDGLAMSSRNARLKPADRDVALTLYQCIQEARRCFAAGMRDPAELRKRLQTNWPVRLDLDYMDFRDPVNLDEVSELAADTRIFLGAWLHGVRLIDNGALVDR